MITALLLAMLGTALVAVIIAMVRAPSGAPAPVPPQPQPAPGPAPAAANPLELDPWDAHNADVVSVAGAAEDFSDVDFPVDRRGAFEASNHRWIHLSGEYRGSRVHVEIYRYPQADVLGFFENRQLTIADVGLSEDQLVDLDSRQDASATVSFDSKTWRYESSREIRYFENEAGAGVGLYRWLFAEKNGSRLLCIEKFEGEPFEVRVARRIEKRDITVYRP